MGFGANISPSPSLGVLKVAVGASVKYIQQAIAVVFLIGFAPISVRADTVTFTLTSPLDSSTPGEIISFTLQQGQAPNYVSPSCCGGSGEVLNAYAEYLNVPIRENGISETGDVYFCDIDCPLFSSISALNLEYLGGNSEPWAGLLTSPEFIAGSYQSQVDCFSEILPQCENYPNTNPLLTIIITSPEISTFPLVLLGTVCVFIVRRVLRAVHKKAYAAQIIVPERRKFVTPRNPHLAPIQGH